MEQLAEIMNMIDEIKEKINDEEYKNLVNKIKEVNDEKQDLYLLEYLEQSLSIELQDINRPNRHKINMTRKVIIAKFDKKYFENDTIIDRYVKAINGTGNENGGNRDNLYIRTNWDFPKIQINECNCPNGEYIQGNFDGERDEDDDIFLEYQQFIPISIKKI